MIASLSIEGLPGRLYGLRHRRLDEQHSNLVRAWAATGGGDWPRDDQWEELAERSRLEDLEPARVVEVHDGTANPRYLAPPLAVVAFVLGLLVAVPAPLVWEWLALGLAAPLGYLAGVLALGLAVGRKQPLRVRLRVPLAMGLMHFAWGIGFLRRSR